MQRELRGHAHIYIFLFLLVCLPSDNGQRQLLGLYCRSFVVFFFIFFIVVLGRDDATAAYCCCIFLAINHSSALIMYAQQTGQQYRSTEVSATAVLLFLSQ